MANGNVVEDPRAVKAAQLSALRTPAALPTPNAAGDVQAPQFGPPGFPAGMLPPVAGPVEPAGNLDQLTQTALQQAEFGRQNMASDIAKMRGLGEEQSGLRQEQAQLAPHLAYHGWGGDVDAQHPMGHFFEPVTGVGSFFRDLGRGALGVGAATAPGRAIEGAVYSGPRQKYSDVSNRIREIQEQMGTTERALEPEAQMGYHPVYSAVRAGTEAAEIPIKQMNADTYRLATNNQLQLRNRALDIEDRYRKGVITEQQAMIEMRRTVADIQQGTATTVAGMYADQRDRAVQTEAAQNEIKTEADYWLQRLTGLLPKKPVTPAIGGGANKPSSSGKGNDKRGSRPPGW